MIKLVEKGLRVAVYTVRYPHVMRPIGDRFPQTRVKIGLTEEDFLRDLAESDVALLQQEITESMGHAMARIIAETGRTRWIHWGYSGINLLAPFRSIGAQLVVTTSKGLCSFMIADYVIMVMHMLLRRFPQLMKNQQNKRWSQGPYISLRGKTLGIIGLGNIGQRVARKASVFDMRVIGLARRPMVVEHVEQIFLADQMQAFLQSSDIVVIAVPLTAETRGMIGAGQIGWMQPHSYIVNVARGHILDEEALV